MQRSNNTVLIILGALLVLSLGLNAIQYVLRQQPSMAATINSQPALAKQIEANHFQAVFLTNGQTYFGHLTQLDSASYKLSDVYYANASDSNTLIKLGAELHRPEDAMIVPADQVLFWENLQSAAQYGGQLQ